MLYTEILESFKKQEDYNSFLRNLEFNNKSSNMSTDILIFLLLDKQTSFLTEAQKEEITFHIPINFNTEEVDLKRMEDISLKLFKKNFYSRDTETLNIAFNIFFTYQSNKYLNNYLLLNEAIKEENNSKVRKNIEKELEIEVNNISILYTYEFLPEFISLLHELNHYFLNTESYSI